MSFRREKFVPKGGPDGGDGGRGGNVTVVADSGDTTLSAYRHRRRFRAQHGRPGEAGNRRGGDGADVLLHVPPGTLVRDGDEVIADLFAPGMRVVAVRGGRGGRGNARFATSTRQAPRAAELGQPGEQRRMRLELKLIADAGLVGLPNAGKSTLLAALTGAHPKIAAYPFTTLHPNLGVVQTEDGRTVVLADVPGLIAGAHQGAGLGIDFLRHVERTRMLVHVVDASAGVDAARAALRTVLEELGAFSPALAARPTLIAFNKLDVPAAAETADMLLHDHPGSHRISAARGDGLGDLIAALVTMAGQARAPEPLTATEPDDATHRVYRHRPRRAAAPLVTREDGAYRVSEPSIERAVQMTDLDNSDAVTRLHRRLQRAGVDDALSAAGCVDGDTVRIAGEEFTYVDGGLAP